MLKEDDELAPKLLETTAKSALKELIFYAFMVISVIITIIIAYNMQSWWPFAGWFAATLAFGLWLGT